jgi:hypothetical protein
VILSLRKRFSVSLASIIFLPALRSQRLFSRFVNSVWFFNEARKPDADPRIRKCAQRSEQNREEFWVDFEFVFFPPPRLRSTALTARPRRDPLVHPLHHMRSRNRSMGGDLSGALLFPSTRLAGSPSHDPQQKRAEWGETGDQLSVTIVKGRV